MNNQLSLLKELISLKHPVTTFSITSGKGGVGKTVLSILLASFISKRGCRVLLIDGDVGLANANIMLGVFPDKNLYHLVSGDAVIEEVIVDTPLGFKLLPAGSGIRELLDMSYDMRKRIAYEITKLDGLFDYVIVDTAAGIGDDVFMFTLACQETIVVVTPEPTSVVDAYSLIKILFRDFGKLKVNVIVNKSEDLYPYEMLSRMVESFLPQVRLELIGTVPQLERIGFMVVSQDFSGFELLLDKFDPIVDRLTSTEDFPRIKGGMGRLALGFLRYRPREKSYGI